jgi:hypothetical protein
MATLQERLDDANRKIDKLEAEAAELRVKVADASREAASNFDDRFRGAVDPIGHRVEDRLDLTRGTAKDPVRLVGWVIVAIVICGVIYLIYRSVTP